MLKLRVILYILHLLSNIVRCIQQYFWLNRLNIRVTRRIMATVHKPDRNSLDLDIVVDNIDAIKAWSEQIESALAALKPKYHVARSGISHLDRNRNRFKSTKKLLFLLDTKHQTFDSSMMKQWIEHFRRRKAKDVMCVLVNSNSDERTNTPWTWSTEIAMLWKPTTLLTFKTGGRGWYGSYFLVVILPLKHWGTN